MTTITIKNGEKQFAKTSFETAKELFIYLSGTLKPLKLYLIDQESISKKSLEKIEKSIRNSNRKLTDFQG